MNSLREFSPDPSTFDIEWLEPVTEDGVSLRPFRLTTFRLPSGPVRNYGVVGFPEGPGPFPAILHIHGGAQTVSRDNVRYNVRRGYAAMSFDWGFWGTSPAQTVYPESFPKLEPLPACQRHGVTHSFPFLATCAARCCLSLLASLDEVDSERIGIYGISWGGFITWLVNGTDSRPRCAVPIYGTGGLHRPGHCWNHEWGTTPESVRREWMRCMEPAGYAFTQQSPVLHINGTNDFFGGVDIASDIMPSIPTDWRCDFTPNTNHGFDAGSRLAMEAWFDHHLRGGPPVPATPPIRVTATGADSLRVETEGRADELTLWTAFGSAPHALRCWEAHSNWQRAESGGLACDLTATGDAWLFVRYTDKRTGISVSSTPICLRMDRAHAAPDPILFGGPNRQGGWGFQFTIEPESAGSLEKEVTIDADGLAIDSDTKRRLSLVFFGMNRPESRPTADTKAIILKIEGCARLNITCAAGPLYECKVEAPDDGLLRLTADRFRDGNNAPLPGFQQISCMVIGPEPRSDGTARIRQMAWG